MLSARSVLDDGVVTDDRRHVQRGTVEPVSVADLDGTIVVVGKAAGASSSASWRARSRRSRSA